MIRSLLVVLLAAAAAAAPKTLDEIRIRDPFVLPVPEAGLYYLYGTNHWHGGPGFHAFKSRDLKTWEGPIEVFRPAADYWGQRDFWAPEVHRYRGRYYMFATFSPRGVGPRGTAVLAADSPEGPFVPHSDGPVTPREWYALDGTLFIDPDGKPWIVFCHEWVQIGDGAMCAVRLSEDLARAEGDPITLFHASAAPWTVELPHDKGRGRVTDGPWLHRNADGSLLMLWSSFGPLYSVGSARSASGAIAGPWSVDAGRLFTLDGGHPMLFTTFDGQPALSIHRPNAHPRERAAFFRMRSEAGGLAIEGPLFK